MIVYLRTAEPRPSVNMRVTPGQDSSDFRDPKGRPITFSIDFINGRAEVPDNLGRWMVHTGRASSHRYTLIQAAAPELILPRRSA